MRSWTLSCLITLRKRSKPYPRIRRSLIIIRIIEYWGWGIYSEEGSGNWNGLNLPNIQNSWPNSQIKSASTTKEKRKQGLVPQIGAKLPPISQAIQSQMEIIHFWYPLKTGDRLSATSTWQTILRMTGSNYRLQKAFPRSTQWACRICQQRPLPTKTQTNMSASSC